MIKSLFARIKQGHHTLPYPKSNPTLPERFRGVPQLTSSFKDYASSCAENCPTQAISGTEPTLDLGKCLFCPTCKECSSNESFTFTSNFQLSRFKREDLLFKNNILPDSGAIQRATQKLFRKSFRLRQVSAGGCNACEADINVLTTIAWDIARFGIDVVASPRHADGLIVTGPVTENMRIALEKTYAATPDPKVVIAVGACAISGGIYQNHPQQHGGVDGILPVDVFVPGCPPHPITILEGLLRFLGRVSL